MTSFTDVVASEVASITEARQRSQRLRELEAAEYRRRNETLHEEPSIKQREGYFKPPTQQMVAAMFVREGLRQAAEEFRELKVPLIRVTTCEIERRTWLKFPFEVDVTRSVGDFWVIQDRSHSWSTPGDTYAACSNNGSGASGSNGYRKDVLVLSTAGDAMHLSANKARKTDSDESETQHFCSAEPHKSRPNAVRFEKATNELLVPAATIVNGQPPEENLRVIELATLVANLSVKYRATNSLE